MIVKRHFKNPIVHKLNDAEFKDTSNADDLNVIYDDIEQIGLDLESLLQFLQTVESEESSYLWDKLAKVRKYLAGIAFRPGCYDSQGDYFGDNNSCVDYNGCMNIGVSDAGGYPGDCVITSE